MDSPNFIDSKLDTENIHKNSWKTRFFIILCLLLLSLTANIYIFSIRNKSKLTVKSIQEIPKKIPISVTPSLPVTIDAFNITLPEYWHRDGKTGVIYDEKGKSYMDETRGIKVYQDKIGEVVGVVYGNCLNYFGNGYYSEMGRAGEPIKQWKEIVNGRTWYNLQSETMTGRGTNNFISYCTESENKYFLIYINTSFSEQNPTIINNILKSFSFDN
jgi:hypothetical protein